MMPQNTSGKDPSTITGTVANLSDRCKRGLQTARTNERAVFKANEQADTLREAVEGYGVDWRVLAAISLRETGFRNIDQGGGPGRAGGYSTSRAVRRGGLIARVISTTRGMI